MINLRILVDVFIIIKECVFLKKDTSFVEECVILKCSFQRYISLVDMFRKIEKSVFFKRTKYISSHVLYGLGLLRYISYV